MKLLLSADIHGRADWFQFLGEQTADAVLIAGDLIDAELHGDKMPQMMEVTEWCSLFKGFLALSSGNHDANDGDRIWMDALKRQGVVTDRRSELLKTSAGDLVITTIPFSFMSSPDPISESLWKAGAALREESGAPWIVLHHEPPKETLVGGILGDGGTFYRILEYCPDFVLSGHIHFQPYRGSFADKLGSTWCFNPGYPDQRAAVNAPSPNHIVLDLAEKTATWNASSMDGPIKKTVSIE